MSFGQGKRLKYLTIRGQFMRTGEPDVDDPDVRVYRAVTLKDDDAGGQEVHFRVMFIPRRLEDALEGNGAGLSMCCGIWTVRASWARCTPPR